MMYYLIAVIVLAVIAYFFLRKCNRRTTEKPYGDPEHAERDEQKDTSAEAKQTK